MKSLPVLMLITNLLKRQPSRATAPVGGEVAADERSKGAPACEEPIDVDLFRLTQEGIASRRKLQNGVTVVAATRVHDVAALSH